MNMTMSAYRQFQGKRQATVRTMIAAVVTAVMVGATLPASAQDTPAQRQAGPTPIPAPGVAPAVPATTPLTDMLTRIDALETQMAHLTAQNEELVHRQHEIEARLGPAPAPTEATSPAIGAATQGALATAAPASAPVPALAPVAGAANSSNLAAMTSGASEPEHAAHPAHASAQRIAAVKAVIKPQTADAASDDYAYGFRLYAAKFYPEAAQQLKLYIEKYPKDAQISYARNLLGRAYGDDGKPGEAAQWFLTNYKADPNGARAPDSLLNLAMAMRQLHDTTKACVALNEFAATYAVEAKGRLREDYAKTRAGLTCN